MTTIRQQAIANENALIDASQARAVAAAKPRSALEAMAGRLQITPANLKNTLMATVFKECRNDAEFAALIVVANEFGLNPLTKEIYAFPAKGGGVVPMVSVDGWIRLMNEHPQFDGIEFEYTLDAKGQTVAVESIIYRRDRTRPVKVMEWMEECKGNTGPWQKSPRRMLRHRALIQGVRIAFGFSGLAAEDDSDVIEASFTPVQSLPDRKSIAEELNDEIPSFDKETGEIIETDANTGMTVVTEEMERELSQSEIADQTINDIDGPLETAPAAAPNPWDDNVDQIKADITAAKTPGALKDVEKQYLQLCAAWSKEVCDEIENMFREKRNGGAK